MPKAAQKKHCFVVGPIGGDESDDRVHADWLLEAIIRPVFASYFKEFEVNRADKFAAPGRIDAQVITALLDADLVIADLTTLNPNAFYEIGIRHTIQKPIIHMRLENQPIPFDIASFRTISFSRRRPRDLETAQEQLKEAVTAVLAPGYEVDNPVTFSRGKVEFAQSATDTEKILIDELEELRERFDEFERNMFSNRRPQTLGDSNDLFSSLSSRPIRPDQTRIKLMPGSPQGIETFQRDRAGIVEGIFPVIINETGDNVSCEYLVPSRDVNRNSLRALKKALAEPEIEFTIIDPKGETVARG